MKYYQEIYSEDNAKRLWDYLRGDAHPSYSWKVGPTGRRKLLEIIPSAKDVLEEIKQESPDVANIRLRKVLSPYIGNKSLSRYKIAKWIISDWGGIRRISEDSIKTIVDNLGDFSDARIDKFCCDNWNNRISSWSKIVAFFDSDKYAIYDSRTAVALNCGLARFGFKPIFYMPPGRNGDIVPAYQKIIDKFPDARLLNGYSEYMKLLRMFVKVAQLESVTHAEMVLFERAPAIAVEYRHATKNF